MQHLDIWDFVSRNCSSMDALFDSTNRIEEEGLDSPTLYEWFSKMEAFLPKHFGIIPKI